MKTDYRLLTLFLCAILSASVSCKKAGNSELGGSPEQMAEQFADAMCKKMGECLDQQFASMPPNVREMAKKQMSPEKCRAMAKNPSGRADSDNLWKKLSDAERASALACMKAMPKAACAVLMKNAVPECVEWQKIAKAKAS